MPRLGKRGKLGKMSGDSTPREISSINSCGTESQSVYLVVGHDSTRPSYSVFEVNPFADGGDGETWVRIRHRMRHASLDAKHCMSFVPVRSRHGPWIVGVGGDSAHEDYAPETIIFDTKTRAVITGPKLVATKFYPVLLPVGDRIYALSRNPDVKEEPDFVPWFEVLDLSNAQVIDDRLASCEWRPLPRPPFFPWELTPRQYIVPPKVAVKSYVVVGSCILVSVTGQRGTHMFHTETEHWAKLDNKDLPFIRGAIPHGPLFLGLSCVNEQIAAYKITVFNTSASSSVETRCPYLSIAELPIVSDMEAEVERALNTSIFVSLGHHGFCSFSCSIDDRTDPTVDPRHTREFVRVRAYTSHDQFNSFGNLLVSNQREQLYHVRDSFRGLMWPCLQAVISF